MTADLPKDMKFPVDETAEKFAGVIDAMYNVTRPPLNEGNIDSLVGACDTRRPAPSGFVPCDDCHHMRTCILVQ